MASAAVAQAAHPQHFDRAAAWSSGGAACTKAHAFDRECHLPGEAFCTIEHTAAEREQILRADGHTCHNHGRAPRAQVSNSYVFQGTTYYMVKFADAGSKARYYFKHYDDFVDLRRNIQEHLYELPWNEAPISVLPLLPETGRFGVRHKLSSIGMGNFAQKLQADLDGWLHMILSQVSSLSIVPALETFFGEDLLPAGMQEVERAKLEDLHALFVRGASDKEVATAAAKQEKEGNETKGCEREESSQPGRRLLTKQKTAAAFAFESAGLDCVEEEEEKRDGEEKSLDGAALNDLWRRHAKTHKFAAVLAKKMKEGKNHEGEELLDETSSAIPRNRQLRKQQTASGLAFESVGLGIEGEKTNAEEQEHEGVLGTAPFRRQLRTQKTSASLAFESAGLETVDKTRQGEEEHFDRTSSANTRRRQLRTQNTAGCLAFESAGF